MWWNRGLSCKGDRGLALGIWCQAGEAIGWILWGLRRGARRNRFGTMSETEERTDTPQAVPSNLAPLAVSARSIERIIALFSLPSTTHAAVARHVFDGRTNARTVKAWRLGTRYVAPWALELVDEKFKRGAELVRSSPGVPGISAGWRNVHGYAANKR